MNKSGVGPAASDSSSVSQPPAWMVGRRFSGRASRIAACCRRTIACSQTCSPLLADGEVRWEEGCLVGMGFSSSIGAALLLREDSGSLKTASARCQELEESKIERDLSCWTSSTSHVEAVTSKQNSKNTPE